MGGGSREEKLGQTSIDVLLTAAAAEQCSAVQYTAVTGVEERRLLLLAPNSAVHRRES